LDGFKLSEARNCREKLTNSKQRPEIPPRRGSILDRNGKQLAISATVDRIVVNPTEIDKSPEVREQIAKKLAEFLDLDEEAVLKKINKTNSRYEIIKKRVEKSIGDQIRQWKSEEKIKGLYIDEDTKRYYPREILRPM